MGIIPKSRFTLSSRHYKDDDFNFPEIMRSDLPTAVQYAKECASDGGETFVLRKGKTVVCEVNRKGTISWKNRSYEIEYAEYLGRTQDEVEP